MNVVLAGFGLEGRASLNYWQAKGHTVTVADERGEPSDVPEGVNVILGPDAFSGLGDADVIIRSPSVSPHKLPYEGKVWSATNEFLAECPAPIIGVTGTKGKGTTSSLIASILRAAGKTVHLVGNIGTPALAELSHIAADDIVVFEMSSFQLWDVVRSPQVAVVLGIERDHLDVHGSMEEYVAAKANITKFQTKNDLLVYNANNSISRSIGHASPVTTIEYPFDMSEYADTLVIPGPHNVDNASAAVAAVSRYNIAPEVIRQGLHDFTGLPHRIKFIRELNGIRFYDDSYSSAPSATVAALKSFDQPKVVLLGGFDKGADFSDLAEYMAASSDTIRGAVIYGATRKKITDILKKHGFAQEKIHTTDSTDFAEIVRSASAFAQQGDVVLLSPGCASFDMFKNFTERGEQFQSIVESL